MINLQIKLILLFIITLQYLLGLAIAHSKFAMR